MMLEFAVKQLVLAAPFRQAQGPEPAEGLCIERHEFACRLLTLIEQRRPQAQDHGFSSGPLDTRAHFAHQQRVLALRGSFAAGTHLQQGGLARRAMTAVSVMLIPVVMRTWGPRLLSPLKAWLAMARTL